MLGSGESLRLALQVGDLNVRPAPQVISGGPFYGRLTLRHAGDDLHMPLTLTVSAPPDGPWVEVNGALSSLGYCEAQPAPLTPSELAAAALTLTAQGGEPGRLALRPDGSYRFWLAADDTDYVLAASAAQHLAASRSLRAQAGAGLNADLPLRLLAPCISLSAPDLALTLDPGSRGSRLLRLSNHGAQDSRFDLRTLYNGLEPFAPGAAYPPGISWLQVSPVTGTLAAGASLDISLQMQPAADAQPGLYQGTLLLHTQDVRRAPLVLPLYLTVPSYAIELYSSNPLLSGAAGSVVNHAFTLRNAGSAEAGPWVDALQAQGCPAAALPLIAIAPPADAAPVHAAWSALPGTALVMFVSANAVQAFFATRPPGAAWPAARGALTAR